MRTGGYEYTCPKDFARLGRRRRDGTLFGPSFCLYSVLEQRLESMMKLQPPRDPWLWTCQCIAGDPLFCWDCTGGVT